MTLHEQSQEIKEHADLVSLIMYVGDTDALLTSAVLPEQVYPQVLPGADKGPELALRRAVLIDAINCFFRLCVNGTPATRKTRLARQTINWLFTDDEEWPFSFIHICSALGLDPTYIRDGLLRWLHGTAQNQPKGRRRTNSLHTKLAA